MYKKQTFEVHFENGETLLIRHDIGSLKNLMEKENATAVEQPGKKGSSVINLNKVNYIESHENANENRSQNETFECEICGKEYKIEDYFKEHVKECFE